MRTPRMRCCGRSWITSRPCSAVLISPTTRDTFQRDSILALQAAISDLIRAVHKELDRVLADYRQTGAWPARQWETPTATGWSDALLRLEQARARVFDDQLRSLAAELRTLA